MHAPRSIALLLACSLAGGAAALVLAEVSCAGHHEGLAPDDGGGGAVSSSSAKTSAASGQGGSAPLVEPDGPIRFTIVDGVVDAPSVSYCFLPYPNGTLGRAPFPSGGLAFGHAMVLPEGSPDMPAGDALMLEIAGTVPPGATCDAIADDPAGFPALTVVELGVLPATALAMKRSFLLVTDGCLGDPTHTSAQQEAICGVGYTPDTPNPGLTVATMSRIVNLERVGFQAVHTIAALSPLTTLDIGVAPGFDGAAPRMIGGDMALGALLPFPPYVGLGASDIGSVAAAKIVLTVVPNSVPNQTVLLGDALALAGLESVAVQNGKNVVLVAVGPTPGLPAAEWWNGSTVVAVSADPS